MSRATARIAVFAYGSLVSRASIEATLGTGVGAITPAELHGWRRGFTLGRRNREVEKTFARAGGGAIPEWVLALNIEPAADSWLNGALVELDETAGERLDLREMRYRRRDVGSAVRVDGAPSPLDGVFTYVARAEHQASPAPRDAVILRSYVDAVESAFAELGPGELARYLATTEVPAVEIIQAELVRDEIPPGNPRAW